jgi:hypothetical protein
VILGWNQGNTWGARLSAQFASHGPVPMIGFTTSRGWPTPREAITPRGVAFGQGDGYLTALNRAGRHSPASTCSSTAGRRPS